MMSDNLESDQNNAFPMTVQMEGVNLSAFESAQALFERIDIEIDRRLQSLMGYLNVHVANTALISDDVKCYLEQADSVYMDGAGIRLGAKILGFDLPARLTAADWFIELLQFLNDRKRSVYLLGGRPQVPDKMIDVLKNELGHVDMISGFHHGYILNDEEAEQAVIAEINRQQPDVLIVGFGTPLQESWILKQKDQLNVRLILPLGAVMDYYTGSQPRCPKWMGEIGCEWLYRLCSSPKRLFSRYVIGNPSYLGRMILQRLAGINETTALIRKNDGLVH